MKKLNFAAVNFMRYFFLKLTRATLVSLSIWTMVFAPVAYGAQASKQFDQITQNELKQLVINLGLNKRMTYKEFWEKTKHLYPTKVHGDVEATFLSQPSAIMPKFEVTFTQDSSGKKIPTLKITDRGNTTNVQIIGELNEWARVNGVSLSESDLKQIRPALEKLNPATVQLETYKKDFNRFTGFPRMTPELWKSLKPEARARYIIEMRLLWFEARRVIEANAPSAKFTPVNPKQKKSPINPKQKGKKTSSFEEFIRVFIGQDAEAIETGIEDDASRAARATPAAGAASSATDSEAIRRADALAKSYQKEMAPLGYGGKECVPPKGSANALGCVVAGQVARDGAKYYTASNVNGPNQCACNYHATLVQRYNNAPAAEKADAAKYFEEQVAYNKECTRMNSASKEGVFVSCNPLIYGFDPKSGQPHCINTQSREFQNATLFESGNSQQTCDQMSPLGPNPAKFANFKIRDEKDRSKVLEMMENDPTAEKNAENFLQGFLKRKGKLKGDQELATLLTDPKSKYDPAIDAYMVDAQEQFEKEIKKAMNLCVQNKLHEASRSQDEACNQLHRRWLFAEKILTKYRAKSCIGGEYIWEKDKSKNRERIDSAEKVCKCPDKSELPLGSTCPTVAPPAKLAACAHDSKIHGEFTCLCPNGNEYMRTESEGQNNAGYYESCHSPSDEKQNCEADYPGVPAADMEPTSCLCITGSGKGELPVIGKAPVYDRSPKTSKQTEKTDTGTTTTETTTVPAEATLVTSEQYTCNPQGFNWLKWLGIAALATGAAYLLYQIFKKDKDPDYTCNEGPNFRYNQQLGVCYCPLKDTCPGGLHNPACSACVPQPVCTPPKSKGTYPACSCPNTCLMGTNHPVTCECEEGGNGNVNPDNNGGGLPPVTPVGR